MPSANCLPLIYNETGLAAMPPATQSEAAIEYRRDEFVLSTNRERLNLGVIHSFLTESYWARGISKEIVARSIENSLCFGVYTRNQQVGFARVISDFATYAYIGDVFVLSAFRGRGLGKWLIECIVQHPRLQGLRRWSLATDDAHGLYAKFGFTAPKWPEVHMERYDEQIYQRSDPRQQVDPGD
jgi:N-acetylglutamate synthase-like GNAT family acetyltransferase